MKQLKIKAETNNLKAVESKFRMLTEDELPIWIKESLISGNLVRDFEHKAEYQNTLKKNTANKEFIKKPNHNIKDYTKSTIPVFTAEQFLRTL